VFAGHPFNAIMKPLLMPSVIGCVATIGLGNILGSLRAPVKQERRDLAKRQPGWPVASRVPVCVRTRQGARSRSTA
jgi:hypothetical protein